jgi:type II secretory pathway pseudopilin PulG
MGSSRRTTVGRPAGPGRGFTVVEILVVLGIVIGVISTLVVGLGLAARRARVANTEFLMNSIVAGMTRFRAETGYIPPILGDAQQLSSSGNVTNPNGNSAPAVGWLRNVLLPSPLPVTASGGPNYGAWSASQVVALQRWCSATTIPEYLLGLGDRSQDGYGVIMESNGALPTNTGTPGYREQPTLGIRNPGQDGAWGSVLNPRPSTAGNGLFASRNLAAASASTGNADSTTSFLRGKSLGPYIEVKAESELGGIQRIDAGIPIAVRTGDTGYFDSSPKCLLDYFGKPIVFYRRGYLNGDPRSTDRSWSLADVVALRPQRFNAGEDLDAMPDAQGDTSASRAALAAEFALFSSGPDQAWDQNTRADAAGYNEDNIVRYGP